MVICLERSTDGLPMVQLMPLLPHHLLLQQNPQWFILLFPDYPGFTGKGLLNKCCCIALLNDEWLIVVHMHECPRCKCADVIVTDAGDSGHVPVQHGL